MTTEEVRAFLTTDPEGQALLEDLKKPLLQKRDELLAELTKANGKSGEALQRSADSDKLLADERAAIKKIVLDDHLDRLLSAQGVPDLIRPGVITSVLNAHDVQLQADGLDRKAVVRVKDDNGQALSLDLPTFVKDHWSKTPEAMQVTLAPANGGAGMKAPGRNTSTKVLSLSAFEALPPAERVAFSLGGGAIE